MEKIWKKVLNSVWKSDRTMTLLEISEDTSLTKAQVYSACAELKHMKLIKSEKIWKNIRGIPRSHVEIKVNQSYERRIKRILEDGGY